MALAVTEIAPASGAVGVLRGTPVVLRLQNPASVAMEIVETATADFAAGTLTDVTAAVDRLQLTPDPLVDDFEAYAAGSLPAEWEAFDGAGVPTVETFGGSQVLQIAGSGGSTGRSVRWLDAGQAADRDFKVKVRSTIAAGGLLAAFARVTADDTYYYAGLIDGTTLYLRKRVAGTTTDLDTAAIAWSADTWYWIRIQVTGTAIKAKAWADGGAEPGTWDVEATDSAITAAGYVAVRGSYTTANTWYFDDATLLGEGTTYTVSGNRVSPSIDLSAIGDAGAVTIEWDRTLPAGTTMTVEVNYDSGGYVTVASGDAVPGITPGADLTGKALLYKVSMTGDGTATPYLTEVRIVNSPLDPASVEVIVGGVSCTTANGLLEVWNTRAISGGVIVEVLDDLYFSTVGVDWWQRGGGAVTVSVEYAGTEIATAPFTAVWGQESGTVPAWWFAQNGTPSWRTGAALEGWWFCQNGTPHWKQVGLDSWWVSYTYRGETFDANLWYLIANAREGQVDVYYKLGHWLLLLAKAAAVVGEPTFQAAKGAGEVRGWNPLLARGAGVVQGWQIRDARAAGVVAVPFERVARAAGVVGIPLEALAKAAGVVFPTWPYTTIDVVLVDAETAAALAELGITIQ